MFKLCFQNSNNVEFLINFNLIFFLGGGGLDYRLYVLIFCIFRMHIIIPFPFLEADVEI